MGAVDAGQHGSDLADDFLVPGALVGLMSRGDAGSQVRQVKRCRRHGFEKVVIPREEAPNIVQTVCVVPTVRGELPRATDQLLRLHAEHASQI